MKRWKAGKMVGMALLVWAWALPSWGLDFPGKPVNLLVGYVPGGPSDIQARALASAAEPLLGQPMVVSNKPGATGTVMLTQVANSKPDGYTLALTPGSIAIAPFVQKVSYDLIKDFSYIVALAVFTESINVRADSPFKNLKELVEHARQNPNQVKIGTPGVGVSIAVIADAIGKQAGVQWTTIPFKGGGEVAPALLGGHIHAGTNSGEQLPLVRAGKVRMLGVAMAERMKEFPDVPTFREQGFNFVTFTLCGIVGPKGIPDPVAKKLIEVFSKAKDQPAYQETVKNLNMFPVFATGKDFQQLMAGHYRKIGEHMKK